MTNRTHIDGIPATADATMMHILTHGFSSLHADHKRRPTATKRIKNAPLAAKVRELIAVKAASVSPVTTGERGTLNASIVGDQSARRSKRLRVTRQVEVVRLKTVDGFRREVSRTIHEVECKRVRKH